MVDDHLKGCVVEAKAQVGNAGAEISHVTDAFARSVRSWKLAGSAQRCKQLLARLLATSAHFGANSAVFVALGVPAAFIPAGAARRGAGRQHRTRAIGVVAGVARKHATRGVAHIGTVEIGANTVG